MSHEMDNNAPYFDFNNSWFGLSVEDRVGLQFILKQI